MGKLQGEAEESRVNSGQRAVRTNPLEDCLFRNLVPMAALVRPCKLQTFFSDRTCLNFAFQFVNPLCFPVVFRPFCERQTPKYLILPSLGLIFAEPCQFGLGLFLNHDGALSGE
jgi:hypothetical protein